MPTLDVRTAHATWTTPFSDELWKKLEELAPVAREADGSSKRDHCVLGPTLPDDSDSRIATLTVHHHDKPDSKDHLFWVLAIRPAPKSKPPEQVIEGNQRINGRQGLATMLADSLPPGVPGVASFKFQFLLPEGQFTSPLVPAAVELGTGHDAALRLSREARIEQVGYRFEGGAGGLEEVAIVYFHREKQYSVTIAAKGPLKLGSPRWLPFMDDIGDLVVNAFFLSKEVST